MNRWNFFGILIAGLVWSGCGDGDAEPSKAAISTDIAVMSDTIEPSALEDAGEGTGQTFDADEAQDAASSGGEDPVDTGSAPVEDIKTPATPDVQRPAPDTQRPTQPDVKEPAEDTDQGAADVPPSGNKALPGGMNTYTLEQEIEGEMVERQFIVHAPNKINANKKYPVVFGFHGNGGQGQAWVNKYKAFVNQGKFIGVYPNGHLKSWNLGSEKSKADDVAFVAQIVEMVSEYKQVNKKKLYAVGSSNGAGMVHELAINTSHFVSIAAMATALRKGHEPTKKTAPVGVLQVHGMKDKLIPYDGGESSVGHVFHASEESADIWAKQNSCANGPNQTTTAEGNTRIEYTDCKKGVAVLHYGIKEAGHGINGKTEGGLTKLVLGFFGLL